MSDINDYINFKLDQELLSGLEAYYHLFLDWNSKINMMSRNNTESLAWYHIAHSLAIAKYISFSPGSKIVDLGTGGGLPGIPLALCFPDVEFILIDARNKKISAVKEMIKSLGLENVSAKHVRAEQLPKSSFDFIVSKAVAPLETLISWGKHCLKKQHANPLPNGLITLKGGDLSTEIKAISKKYDTEKYEVNKLLNSTSFNDKFVTYTQLID